MFNNESSITNSPSYLADLDGIGEIMYVTRLSANSGGGIYIPCRKIPSENGEMSGDLDSLIFRISNRPSLLYSIASNDTMIVYKAKSNCRPNRFIMYFHVSAGDAGTYDVTAVTSIANFPNEAEHFVVLRAAISAAQHKMTYEEDPELYVPIISSLKAISRCYTSFSSAGVAAPQKGAN